MKKVFWVLVLFVGLFLSCSLDPYGEGLGENSTGGNTSIIVPNIETCTKPSAPSSVVAVTQSISSIRISWNSVSGATRYNVYRSLSANGTYSYVGQSSTTSFTHTGLSASTTYHYRVSAENNCGEGVQSNSASATTSGGTGTIRIVNNDDYPITQWILYNSSGTIVRSSSTSIAAGSSFSITNVSAGTYRVNVMGGWFGSLRNETTQNFVLISWGTINVTLNKNTFTWQTY